MKLLNRNSNFNLSNPTRNQSDIVKSTLYNSDNNPIVALTQSWKCCSCRTENYNNKWECSWCKHTRCGNCKQLEG